MNNDPELSGKYLGTITKDFVLISDTLKEAAYQVKKRGFSEYPIFPIAKSDIPIGQLLIPKEEMALQWNYYITYIDEFVQRELISEEGMEHFLNNYKDMEEFCCLFVVDKDFTNFVYVPYPTD